MHLAYYRESSRSGREIPVCLNDIEINEWENESRERLGSGEKQRTRNWPALKKKKKKEIGENYALLRASHAVWARTVFLAGKCNLISGLARRRERKRVKKLDGRLMLARECLCWNDLAHVFLRREQRCVLAKFTLESYTRFMLGWNLKGEEK